MRSVLAIFGYVILGAVLTKLLQPDYSYFLAEKERRTGQLRSAHSRLKAAAESVAMIGGDSHGR